MLQLNEKNVKELQLQSNRDWFESRLRKKPTALVGIAEGDSWFDYAPAWIAHPELRGNPKLGDLINQLNKFSNLNLLRVAKAGDTLENMTFGSEPDGKFNSKSPQLQQTIQFVKEYEPDFFLFSGGGNDVAGSNGLLFEPFLNHSKSSLGLVRQNCFDFITKEYFPEMFQYLIEKILAVKPDIKIFLHGYGYPTPDGRAVLKVLNYDFVGPWFEPALTRKNISQNDGEVIVRRLIDALNNAIAALAVSYPGQVYFIDLRPVIQKSDWANELHLSAEGYQKVSEKFVQAINAAFGKTPEFDLGSPIDII